MTREIKFRVWDIPNERMIEEPYYFRKSFDSYNQEKSDMEYAESWQDIEDGVWRSCFVMQFTGLKDKNGKDIYEGDIFRASEELGHIYEVFHGKYGWVLRAYTNYGCDELNLMNDLLSRYEIAGNICQNADLIPKKKSVV